MLSDEVGRSMMKYNLQLLITCFAAAKGTAKPSTILKSTETFLDSSSVQVWMSWSSNDHKHFNRMGRALDALSAQDSNLLATPGCFGFSRGSILMIQSLLWYL